MSRTTEYLVTIHLRDAVDLVPLRKRQMDLFHASVRPLADPSVAFRDISPFGNGDFSRAVSIDALASLRIVGELVRKGHVVFVRQNAAQIPKPVLIDADEWMKQTRATTQ